MKPCREWTGGRTKDGYGRISKNRSHKLAHVAEWESVNGPKPAGMEVMHICDNPPCYEITHLRLGTRQDNIDDKVSKGRQLRGERSPVSKLTWAQVVEIRSLYSGCYGEQTALARQFGLHPSTVHDIVHKIGWADRGH